MKTSQAIVKLTSHEDHREVLIKKIQEVAAESYQLTKMDIERYLIAKAQSETGGNESGHVICDLINDQVALHVTASMLNHQIRIDMLSKAIEKSKRRFESKKEELGCYLWDRYGLEDGTAFYFDYSHLRIIEGTNPDERQAIAGVLEIAEKLINSSAEQLSVLSGHAEELDAFEKDLIALLEGPEGEEVKSIYKKLLHMNGDELKNFIQKEKRKPVIFIAHMLKDLRNS